MSEEEFAELIQPHIDALREHVDVVRIFVSTDKGSGNNTTQCFTEGSGNLMAQLGQVKDWIIQMDEETRANVRE